MPVFTILFGIALMAIGIGTYIGAGESASLSSFILQMILGLLALGLGVGSIVKQEHRKHLIHGAILLAALGVLVPTIRFAVYLIQEMEREQQMNLIRMVLTVAVSAAYVYTAVQSFRAARRARKGQPAPTAKTTPPPAKPEPKEPASDPTPPA